MNQLVNLESGALFKSKIDYFPIKYPQKTTTFKHNFNLLTSDHFMVWARFFITCLLIGFFCGWPFMYRDKNAIHEPDFNQSVCCIQQKHHLRRMNDQLMTCNGLL